MDERDQIRSTAAEDTATERAALQQVLALHPTPITLDELIRELGDERDFPRRDAVERAVRDLTAAGLLHRRDSFVQPTRAALRFDELFSE